MRKIIVIVTSCVALASVDVLSAQEPERQPTSLGKPITVDAVPKLSKDATIIRRNKDGSVTFSDGMTLWKDGSYVFDRGAAGKLFKPWGGKPIWLPPDPVVMKRDPVTGTERYYRIGRDNQAVEIEFPRDAASKDGDRERHRSSHSQMISGTGFFISADGYLLTNHHLVKDSRKIVVRTEDSERPARVVKIDPANDLALLKIEGSFSAVALGDSRNVAVGDSVMTIGYPNIEVQGTAPKFTKGEVSSLSGFQDDSRLFQISVPIQPGNSGGPLIDERGNVVGITNAQLSALKMISASGSVPQNVNYAVKISYAQLLLDAVPELAPKLPKRHKEKADTAKIIGETQKATALILVPK